MSALARVVLATPPTSPVATPISQSRIDVSWVPVVGAQAYRVYRNGVLVETTAGTTHSSTGLTASTLYTYQLASVDGSTADGPSGGQFSATTQGAPDTTAPTIPTIAVSTGSNTTQTVTLTVASTDSGSGLASYTLDRATNAGFTTNLVTQTLATNAFPVSVSGLTAATAYFYRCRATDGANNTSSNSTTVSAATTGATNQAPVWASSADQVALLNSPFSVTFDNGFCSDPEGQPVTYTIASGTLPTGLVQSGTRGETISGTPTSAGDFVVTFTANDNVGVTNMDTDFAARATALGCTYACNASDVYVARVIQPARAITDSTSLRNEALDTGGTPTNLVRDTVLKLSGTGSIQLITPGSAGVDGGAHWSYRLNGTDSTQFTRFYAQMSIYQTRDGLAYRYPLESGGVQSASQPQQLKLWNIEQNGSAQIAITARSFLGFPSYFCQDGGGFNNQGNASVGTPNPWGSSQEWIQNAIDNGGPLVTKNDYIARYGPLEGISSDVVGAVGGQPAYSAGNPYLYNRTWPSSWPDTRAIAAGGVPFNLDGWTTIGIFVDYNVSNPSSSTFQCWAAAYGEAPTLIFNQINSCPLGSNDVYRRLELLSYDTHRMSETGVRPEIRTNYTEVLVSTLPIKFPGNFSLPNNQG